MRIELGFMLAAVVLTFVLGVVLVPVLRRAMAEDQSGDASRETH